MRSSPPAFAMTIAALLLAATPSAAQETTDGWSYSASIAGYFVPDERDYAQPAFTADRGPVHLEARYNYEALKAGSAWLGYAFSTGSRWRLDITPMLGGVFGDLHGIAPGCELTLGWSKLEFYSESEYVVGLEDDSENFFYLWSELSIAPTDGWRAGLAAQRTRTYETELDVQPGLLAGASYRQLNLTAYVFNLGWEDPTVVISAEMTF